MASNRDRDGVSRVLRKLEICLKDGKYYEAHQMYRTLHFRYVAQKKYTEAINLLYNGSMNLIEFGQHSSGADLGLLLVDVLKQTEVEIDTSFIDKVGAIHRKLNKEMVERSQLAGKAITSTQRPSTPHGHPLLHQHLAVTYWREQAWSASHYHFILSTDGEGTAVMLIDHHLTAGFPSEVDLFLAQAVLQFLCLNKLLSASRCFSTYTDRHPHVEIGPPFVRPLLNFLWLLLLAVEGGRLAVFTVLCERYQPALQRDPSYREYLDRIGQLFFGLPKPAAPSGGGFLGNLLQSLLSDEDTDGPAPNTSVTQLVYSTEDLD